MTPYELRDALLVAVDTSLRPRGYRRRQQAFQKDDKRSRRIFHLSFIPHGSDIDVTADVAIRHHAVETLTVEHHPLLRPQDVAEQATVGVELGNWTDGRQHRWTLAAPEHIEIVANDILKRLNDLGEPFLDRFSDLAEVRRILAEDGREARLICPIPARRAKIVAAAAQVLSSDAV
jgi:hypothetical protein